MGDDAPFWLPFYVKDHLADTQHLDATQHGALCFLLWTYWINRGPIPDDDAYLARVARLSPDEWGRQRPVIEKFFQVKDGKWAQRRSDKEIQNAAELRAKRQRGAATTNAKKSASHSAPDSASHSDTHSAPDSASLKGRYSHTQSQSEKEGEGNSRPPVAKLSSAELILREKELGRVEVEIQKIRSRNGETPLTGADRIKLAGLKDHKIELLQILGMKA